MKAVWTKVAKTPEDKETLEKTLRASTTLIGRLKDILEDDLRALESDQKDFDKPNWEYRQAFLLGQKEQLRKLLSLIDF